MKTKIIAKNFPVVCVGGSAGGLDAYIRLLKNLPANMGVAIVIVNHLRKVATLLHEILPQYTGMPVELITEKLDIKPNHVFIIPEKRDLHILNGEFRLKPISKPWGWPNVITVFMQSMAKNWDGKLVAVIVSGYDGDGAAALSDIKEAGGITIAQKPETAGQPDMPESAISSGCIDFILSPEQIAQQIIKIAHAEPKEFAAQLHAKQTTTLVDTVKKQLAYEQSEKDLNAKILKITMKINDQYPELSQYLEEMPVTVPSENDPAISLTHLQSYYESLNSILNKYKVDYPKMEE